MTDPKNKSAEAKKAATAIKGKVVPKGKVVYVRGNRFVEGEIVPDSLLPGADSVEDPRVEAKLIAKQRADAKVKRKKKAK